MNDIPLAQQMVAAAPAATRNVNLSTDPKWTVRVAQFILGQTDIRDCVPFLINRDNVV